MRLWQRLMCGTCGRGFTADPETVPVFPISNRGPLPVCRHCWDIRDKMRARTGLPPTDRPRAYPEDYSQ